MKSKLFVPYFSSPHSCVSLFTEIGKILQISKKSSSALPSASMCWKLKVSLQAILYKHSTRGENWCHRPLGGDYVKLKVTKPLRLCKCKVQSAIYSFFPLVSLTYIIIFLMVWLHRKTNQNPTYFSFLEYFVSLSKNLL